MSTQSSHRLASYASIAAAASVGAAANADLMIFDVGTTFIVALPATAALVEACADTHRRLLLQTEGARGLVEGVESLCVRAERACDVFAGAIASNDFRSLPSYQSPHRLISGLIGGGV